MKCPGCKEGLAFHKGIHWWDVGCPVGPCLDEEARYDRAREFIRRALGESSALTLDGITDAASRAGVPVMYSEFYWAATNMLSDGELSRDTSWRYRLGGTA